jgi:hypothetical protein
MELGTIDEKDKKTLTSLAKEHGKIFLDEFKGNNETIGIYGISDCDILDFFQNELEAYFSERGRDVKIRQNFRTEYDIDVGYFLRVSYVNSLNKY